MMRDTEIMTVDEVARYLKVKPQTVYRWAQDGIIPAAKIGKEWRFKKSVLDAWIDSQFDLSPAIEKLMAKRKEENKR